MKKRNRIAESFVYHSLKLRLSAAWRALPDNARRVVDRLEVEHMRHGGKENGSLACTYSEFEKAGIRRRSIPLAIRQAVALGFVEVTRRGYRTAGDFKVSNLYRLTHVRGADSRLNGNPTDEWAKILDEAGAAAALATAERQSVPPRAERAA